MTQTFIRDLCLSDNIMTGINANILQNLSTLSIDMNNSLNSNLTPALSGIIELFGGNIVNKQPNYKFAAFSDIHLYKTVDDEDNKGVGNGITDFTRALSIANNHKVAFACVAGDIGNTTSQYDSTENAFDKCINDANIDFSISCCRGNHDQGYTAEQWKNLVSCSTEVVYSFEYNKDLFVFLSLPHLDNVQMGGNKQTNPFDYDDLNRLAEIFQNNKDKRIFMFMHFPLNSGRPFAQYAGLGGQKYPSRYGAGPNSIHSEGFNMGSEWKNTQNTTILNIVKNHPRSVIVFSGHSHYVFDVDIYEPRVIYAQVSETAHTVHIPSLNFPRDRDRTTISESYPERQPSQGFIVECYDDRVVLNGYEFNAEIDHIYGDKQRQYVINTI